MSNEFTTQTIYAGEGEIGKKLQDVTEALTKETILSSVVPKLISKEYADVLKDRTGGTIVEEFFNMRLTYVVCMNELSSEEDGGVIYAIVSDSFCNCFDLTFDEIKAAALNNNKRKMFTIESMDSMMNAMCYGYKHHAITLTINKNTRLEDASFCVVQSIEGENDFGATVLLRDDCLEHISDLLGVSYYIIPSSIHELLVAPDDGSIDTDVLREMITDINEKEVTPKDRLDNQAYYYDKDSKTLSIAI